MALALTVFFIVVTILFIVIAFYFPEWVGITGKKAQQYIREHEQEAPPENQDPSTAGLSTAVPSKDLDKNK